MLRARESASEAFATRKQLQWDAHRTMATPLSELLRERWRAANTGYAVYVLSVVRESPQGESVWTDGKLLLKRGELALVDYRHAPAKGKPLLIAVGTGQGKVTFQTASPEK